MYHLQQIPKQVTVIDRVKEYSLNDQLRAFCVVDADMLALCEGALWWVLQDSQGDLPTAPLFD